MRSKNYEKFLKPNIGFERGTSKIVYNFLRINFIFQTNLPQTWGKTLSKGDMST